MTTTLTQPMPGATLPTYTETQGAPVFDWHAFLAKQSHTDDEWQLAYNLAGGWVSCACGSQCAALPRNEVGAPEDLILYELGTLFSINILNHNIEGAQAMLGFIEQRSALLLTVQAALTGKECNNCAGLGCANCHGGASGKEQAHA
jgi:hypothetical protein